MPGSKYDRQRKRYRTNRRHYEWMLRHGLWDIDLMMPLLRAIGAERPFASKRFSRRADMWEAFTYQIEDIQHYRCVICKRFDGEDNLFVCVPILDTAGVLWAFACPRCERYVAADPLSDDSVAQRHDLGALRD